ncbi:hypothetical protein N8204_00615 [Flavobacteriales bacterium]|nr:hypothetical protein [Flavobacteriales bacterium]
MKQIKFHHALQGPICAVLALSMVFLACQKEDIDELTILEQGEHEPIDIYPPFDCELLQLNIGDTCFREEGGALLEGVVSAACECTVSVACGMVIDLVSSPDDGTGNGSLLGLAEGGTPPYTFAWYQSGALIGSQSNLDGLEFGTYQLVVNDVGFCSTAAIAAVELNIAGWDCPELLSDIGDNCLIGDTIQGIVSADCMCISTLDCSVSLSFLSSTADDGSGNGSAEIYVSGGEGPYEWSLATSDWIEQQAGSIEESAGVLTLNALTSGFYGVHFVDAEGCLAQVLISVP